MRGEAGAATGRVSDPAREPPRRARRRPVPGPAGHGGHPRARPPAPPTATSALGQWLAGGRASALFAVLAGVGLALATGAREPVRGRDGCARSAGIAVRALLVAALGLALGGPRLRAGGDPDLLRRAVPAGAAVPRAARRRPLLARRRGLGRGSRRCVSQVLRAASPPHGVREPDARACSPTRDAWLGELLLTGYYPALPWLAYLLVGHGRSVASTWAGAGSRPCSSASAPPWPCSPRWSRTP